MTLIKICGIRTFEHAQTAAESGADMIGFMFAPSKRRITSEQAAEIAIALRAGGGPVPLLVGVFANETPGQIAATVEQCGLDAIQLSGDEDAAIAEQLPARRLIKAIRLADDPTERGWLALPAERVTLLVDAHVPGSYGGTGAVADWSRAARLAHERPILLAGGLSPANVVAAIQQVRPWGVDVSSGVERDGQKDSVLIRAFVAAAQGR